MHTVQTHRLAANELSGLPEELRGYLFRLIERLSLKGKLPPPHYQREGEDMFLLNAGKSNAWSLFGFEQNDNLYLLQLYSKQTKPTPVKARKLARERIPGLLMESVSLTELRGVMLNSEAALDAYETADSESKMVEVLYEMREHAQLNKSELATRLGITSAALHRLENAPRSASIKTLERYAKACGASISINVSYK